MTIRNINANLFLAAARFVSTEETRYYLKGVYVQHAAGGGLLYTATDGHRLFHAHDLNAEMDGDARIVGITKPKFPAAWFKDSFLVWENGVLSNESKTLLMPAAEVDGTFPEYTRVIPATTSGELAHFNYAYLADCQDAAKRCDLGTPFVHHNGEDPALITFDHAPAFAVLMPLRMDRVRSGRPTLPVAAS
jgi:DNA polymerase III sliding clamp (beta) subunit (PCNA family)